MEPPKTQSFVSKYYYFYITIITYLQFKTIIDSLKTLPLLDWKYTFLLSFLWLFVYYLVLEIWVKEEVLLRQFDIVDS